jgi:hypothetical protein
MENVILNQKEKEKNELPKLLYTIKDAAKILNVSEKSVRRFLERGLLKANPSLRVKLIYHQSIIEFAKMT